MNHHQAAIHDLNEAVATNPTVHSLCLLADTHLRAGDADSAVQVAQRVQALVRQRVAEMEGRGDDGQPNNKRARCVSCCCDCCRSLHSIAYTCLFVLGHVGEVRRLAARLLLAQALSVMQLQLESCCPRLATLVLRQHSLIK